MNGLRFLFATPSPSAFRVREATTPPLSCYFHVLLKVSNTCPDVRNAVDVHEAGGAPADGAEETARTVISGTVAENADTGGVQSRCDCITGVSGHPAPIETKADLFLPGER